MTRATMRMNLTLFCKVLFFNEYAHLIVNYFTSLIENVYHLAAQSEIESQYPYDIDYDIENDSRYRFSLQKITNKML